MSFVQIINIIELKYQKYLTNLCPCIIVYITAAATRVKRIAFQKKEVIHPFTAFPSFLSFSYTNAHYGVSNDEIYMRSLNNTLNIATENYQ